MSNIEYHDIQYVAEWTINQSYKSRYNEMNREVINDVRNDKNIHSTSIITTAF